MDKINNLNWFGICTISLGLFAFLLIDEKKYELIPAILCFLGVVIFIIGFYIKK